MPEDEPVVPTPMAEAVRTLEKTTAHYRALTRLGVKARPESDALIAAWDFLMAASAHLSHDGAVEQQAPDDANGLKRLERILGGPDVDLGNGCIAYVKEHPHRTGGSIFHSDVFLVSAEGDMSPRQFVYSKQPKDFRVLRSNLVDQARRRLTETTASPAPRTVRDAVRDVVEPGEEVDVPTVHARVVERGIETSGSVVSNELSRWSKTGDLIRVRRGRYARPVELARLAPDPSTDLSSGSTEEEGRDAHVRAGDAEGASAV